MVAKRKKITSKMVLKDIAKVLNRGTQESEELWNILTGLRGPDNGDGECRVKLATTAVIRYAIGINPDNRLAIVSSDSLEARETRDLIARRDASVVVDWHFFYHASSAFTALGLSWDRVN